MSDCALDFAFNGPKRCIFHYFKCFQRRFFQKSSIFSILKNVLLAFLIGCEHCSVLFSSGDWSVGVLIRPTCNELLAMGLVHRLVMTSRRYRCELRRFLLILLELLLSLSQLECYLLLFLSSPTHGIMQSRRQRPKHRVYLCFEQIQVDLIGVQ